MTPLSDKPRLYSPSKHAEASQETGAHIIKESIRVNMTEPCIMNTLAQLTPVSWKNALVKRFSTQPLMKFTPKTLLSIYRYSSAVLLFCFVFLFLPFYYNVSPLWKADSGLETPTRKKSQSQMFWTSPGIDIFSVLIVGQEHPVTSQKLPWNIIFSI